jgi:uncharacterized membrane protein YdjX (TVP38/TMEM64 family)
MTLQSPSLPTWLKWLGLAIGLAAVIILVKQFHIAELIQANLKSALTWVEGLGAIAPIAFILIYNIATVFLIPGSILTLGGGVLFGIGWGSFYVIIAATLGATIAFWIGRNFARDWVSQKISNYPKFEAIDRAVAKEGFKIVALTRLSPLFPFNLLNYAFGITQVSLKDYILGSIGMIPGTILYVYIGSLVGSLAQLGGKSQIDPQTEQLQLVTKIVGFLITIGVTLYITRVAKKALDSSIKD